MPLLSILLILSTLSNVSSFTFTGRGCAFSARDLTRLPAVKINTLQRPTTTKTSSQLSVVIYGWDEDDDECKITADTSNDGAVGGGMFHSPSSSNVCSPVGIALAESISTNPDKVGTLARLAVAFSPPERELGLSSIEHVQLICVSEDQIEIEATLCEEHDCVSLYVPIEFPHACDPYASDEVMEQCVLDNLSYLDADAESIVSAKSSINDNQSGEGGLVDHGDDQDLTTITSYPNWWVLADSNPDLLTECNTIQGLLRQAEFQDAVNGLAQKGLEALGIENMYQIQKAAAAAIGPAGIYLKARAQNTSSGQLVVLDVPLPFGGNELKLDPDSLRAAVLGEVAAAQVL